MFNPGATQCYFLRWKSFLSTIGGYRNAVVNISVVKSRSSSVVSARKEEGLAFTTVFFNDN